MKSEANKPTTSKMAREKQQQNPPQTSRPQKPTILSTTTTTNNINNNINNNNVNTAKAPSQRKSTDDGRGGKKSEPLENAQVQRQLEHLAQLPHVDFENDFRQWMADEGIARELHAHMRMKLINTFNDTPLGQKLQQLSNVGGGVGTLTMRQQCLLLSPLALALNTLVAEFLHFLNCHYTLSVLYTELPQRQALPDFDSRPKFRFSDIELQDVLAAVLGLGVDTHTAPFQKLQKTVQRNYHEQRQSLLHATVSALVDTYRKQPVAVAHISTMTEAAITQPTIAHSNMATMTDGQPFITTTTTTTSATSSSNQQTQTQETPKDRTEEKAMTKRLHRELITLMSHIWELAKSCGPPVEVVSPEALELFLRQPNDIPSSVLAVDQPKGYPAPPQLHAEQVASLGLVRHTVRRLQRELRRPPESEHLSSIISDVDCCVQALSNVLNLSMEQEHNVGCHRGYKIGYKAGRAQSAQPPPPAPPAPPPGSVVVEATTQTPLTTERMEKPYEEWIDEMLHSNSGQVFLERVELSLNKALNQQRQRMEDLYSIKLRHHIEMIRLDQRQASWRTLCRRLERDGSEESRELSRQIFRLLKQHETQHQVLAEKIRASENAVHQASRICPILGGGGGGGDGDEQNSFSTTTYMESGISNISDRFTSFPVAPPAAPQAVAVAQPLVQPSVAPGLLPPPPAPAPYATQYQLPPLIIQTTAPPTVTMKPPTTTVATNTTPEPSHHRQKKPQRPTFEDVLITAKNRMLELEQESDLLEQSFLNYLDSACSDAEVQPAPLSPQLTQPPPPPPQPIRPMAHEMTWHQYYRHQDEILISSKSNLSHHPSSSSPPPPPPAAAAAATAAALALASPITNKMTIGDLSSVSKTTAERYKFTNPITEARAKLFPTTTTGCAANLNVDHGAGGDYLMDKFMASQRDQRENCIMDDELLSSPMKGKLNRATAIVAAIDNKRPHHILSDLSSIGTTIDNNNNNNNNDDDDDCDDGDYHLDSPMTPASRKLQQSFAKMQQLFSSDPNDSATVTPNVSLTSAASSTTTTTTTTTLSSLCFPLPILRDRPMSAPVYDNLTIIQQLPQRPATAPLIQKIPSPRINR